jgi:hypothetical protein
MAMYRPYYVDSGLLSVSGTGVLAPLLYFAPPATADANIIALVCSVEVDAATPTAVSNSDLFFSLNKVTGTKAGGAAVTPAIIGPSSLAANTVASSGTTPITGLTQSTELWGHPVPFTAGAFTDQAWENTGREINLAASSTSAFYVRVPAGPGAGSGFFVRVEAWLAE